MKYILIMLLGSLSLLAACHEPEIQPINDPIEEPTKEPGEEPTDEPKDNPNDEPTDNPNDEPTDEPNDEGPDIDYTLSPNFGKSLGIFGGSFSCIEESDSCKSYWQELLQLTLFSHGISGAGYSNLTQENGVQYAVDRCCRRDKPHDIYLLWSPSNDFSKGRATIGTLSDYTEADGFDTTKLSTMLGGMNYCYQKLKQKNPDAEILLFTTLPIFNKGAAGYDTLYTDSIGLRHYVDAQIEWAKAHDVPYLDLFRRSGFTHSNYGPYYQKDKLHPNVEGYKHLVGITLPFLAYPR